MQTVKNAVGCATPDDWQANEHALVEGERLLSVSVVGEETKVFVIMKHDRSATTVMLAEDY